MSVVYNIICRKVLIQYGLWDQLHFDHGKEWYLTIFVNESLAHLRNDTYKSPHRQSSSKQVSIRTSLCGE